MKVSLAVLFVIGALTLSACDSTDVVKHMEGDEAWAEMESGPVVEEDVVAVVDGRAIQQRDLDLLWESHPEWTVEEVLEAAVERELLVGEARRRGLHERPEATFGRKQGLVQALLRVAVEEGAEIDEARRPEIERIVQMRRRVPEGLRASHLVVLVPTEVRRSDGEGTRRLRGEEQEPYFEDARQVLDEARNFLGERFDDDALREAAAWVREDLLDEESLFDVAVNEHLRFPRIHERFEPDQLPRGWTPVVREFAAAADAAAREDRLGELLEPARSEFGWHLIRVDEVLSERPVDPEALEAFVAHQLQLEAHLERFSPALREWVEASVIELYPERLERTGAQGY